VKLLAFSLILPFFIFLAHPFRVVLAQKNNQFITIVNPVRISSYTPNPAESVKTQYLQVAQNHLPATWLLTYDALVHEGIFPVINSMDDNQELGIFLEVSSEFAKAANVKYHQGSWHFANSLFLSGYTQGERKKLVDTVFAKFNSKFGYYPTSVGSWWTDSFSLDYMKQKYNITANLTLADQFSTDGYQVWGQYWSTPFYPSRFHAGIPASSKEVKLDLVNIQWAPRDPLNGYQDSLYSTQDYKTPRLGLDTDFFGRLIRLYGAKNRNEFGQITVGLEGDLAAHDYKREFATQMKLIAKLKERQEFEVGNMKSFSAWYRKSYPGLSPAQIVETDDLLGKKNKIVWYQSPHYRIGLIHDYVTQKTKIFDFRTYHKDLQEPYYVSPNREFELSIYIPSIFDEFQNPEDVWVLGVGELSSIEGNNQEFTINFANNGEIVFRPEKIGIKGNNLEIPKILSNHPALDVEKKERTLEIVPLKNWIVEKDGILVRDLTSEATHFLLQKKVTGAIAITFLVIVALLILILRSRIAFPLKFFLIFLLSALPLIGSIVWYQTNSVNYSVSQGEIDALFHLSVLPPGKVLVYDHECLQCSYQTGHKPAAFANKRKYVEKFAGKPIVYNSSVFEAKVRETARNDFAKLGTKYIYLVKFEDYVEKVPFSPGDLGIEKIYDNANAEIWKVK
jgi:hypothetical protein